MWMWSSMKPRTRRGRARALERRAGRVDLDLGEGRAALGGHERQAAAGLAGDLAEAPGAPTPSALPVVRRCQREGRCPPSSPSSPPAGPGADVGATVPSSAAAGIVASGP